MFAVGVDVSNGRSTVAVFGAKRKVVMKPFEVPHTAEGFASLAEKLNGLDGEIRIVMEHIGRYYESPGTGRPALGFATISGVPVSKWILSGCTPAHAAGRRKRSAASSVSGSP